ncbi:MAG TPA: hypothetical protein VGP65_11445, partial [Candidatus Angelobacter sp.]|nr:hypothetical protein [Candidatus Angelobacter sp.]
MRRNTYTQVFWSTRSADVSDCIDRDAITLDPRHLWLGAVHWFFKLNRVNLHHLDCRDTKVILSGKNPCNTLSSHFLNKGFLQKMKRSFRLLFLFVACGFASAQTSDCSPLTHQALELSGFNQSLDQMAAIMSSDQFMQQVRGRESLERFAAIYVPMVKKEFNATLLRHEMEGRMAAHCDLEQMSQTIQRLQTPFVARMLALDTAASTPEGQEKIKRYIKIAQINPPTDDRMDALDAL